jgi:hypothetical protein
MLRNASFLVSRFSFLVSRFSFLVSRFSLLVISLLVPCLRHPDVLFKSKGHLGLTTLWKDIEASDKAHRYVELGSTGGLDRPTLPKRHDDTFKVDYRCAALEMIREDGTIRS